MKKIIHIDIFKPVRAVRRFFAEMLSEKNHDRPSRFDKYDDPCHSERR